MNSRWKGLAALMAATVVVSAVTVRAETCQLELKRVQSTTTNSVPEMIFLSTYPQHFFVQIGVNSPTPQTSTDGVKFSDVIRREPKYNLKQPFRGVAKLGTQNFGFVLDSATRVKETSKKKNTRSSELVHYQRLHFDVNANGDLTDDEVIKAEGTRGIRFPSSYANYSFPRVDLTVDADGTKIAYAFRFSVYSNSGGSYQYASASLNSAAYREGHVTLNDQKRRVFIVDYNSNGRFDDKAAINDIRTPDGAVYSTPGDMIYLDFDQSKPAYSYGYDVTTNDSQHYVAELLPFEGHFYNVKITPAGDELTLTPSPVAVGHVTNPNQGYRAVIYGEQGFLKIRGDASGQAAVPVGEWKLASYTIDRTEQKEEPQPENDDPSLLKALSRVLGGGSTTITSRPGFTMVSAAGTNDYPAIQVRKGETSSLPFGPPFKPVVKVSYQQGADKVALAMTLVGTAGEACSNLMVKGSRPPDPKFTIKTPDGTEVESGTFEYG